MWTADSVTNVVFYFRYLDMLPLIDVQGTLFIPNLKANKSQLFLYISWNIHHLAKDIYQVETIIS